MSNPKLYVVLDNVRSRENVGSIFRTADAAGVSKIYLCGITSTPPHPKISKTALGAENLIPWEFHKQTWRLLARLKKENFYIFALENTKGSINIFKLAPYGSGASRTGFKKSKNRSIPLTCLHSQVRGIVLVVGNEVKGLSPKILKYCDKKIAIPMYGKKESLNVAVATGIAVYQLR